ncbi:MAG: BMP family ABC transporter substrate-binding protein, partial [Bacillota bacterium]|nr:BMP family ABC transporter substrate-binding protein [Bacillota bacterium]
MKRLFAILLVLVLAFTSSALVMAKAKEGPPSVCVVVGNASDKSFSESVARGAELVSQKYGAKTKVIEYGSDETKVLPTLEDLSDGSWDIIVVAGYNHLENVEDVAERYTKQNYVLLDTQIGPGYPN